MSRHFRNFLFFALAFSLTLLAGFASAANYRTTAAVKYGNAAIYPEPSSKQAATNLIGRLMNDSVQFERQVNMSIGDATRAAELASGAFRETAMVPKSVLVNGAKGLLKGGLAGIATGFLADYLIQKGYQWSTSASSWMKPAPPETWSGTWIYPADNYTGSASQVIAHVSAGQSTTASLYNASDIKICFSGCSWWVHIVKISSTTPTVPPSVATDADLQTQAQAATETDPLKIQQQLEAAEVPTETTGDYVIQPMLPLASPKTTTKTTTTTLPDGSTQTESTECQQLYTVSATAVPYGNSVPVSQDQNCTTTIKKYKPDGTIDTTTSTETTPITDSSGNPVNNPQEQKTDCDKKPDSVGCLDLGDAPDAPSLDSQTVTLSFSWTPFSMPAQCPAPVQVSTHLIPSFTIPYDSLCNAADIGRPLILAGAFLTALGIIFGSRSDD